jgi:ribosomal protein L20
MARVKRGVTAKARHKKVLKLAKGYYGARRSVSIELLNKQLLKLHNIVIAIANNVNVIFVVYGLFELMLLHV